MAFANMPKESASATSSNSFCRPPKLLRVVFLFPMLLAFVSLWLAGAQSVWAGASSSALPPVTITSVRVGSNSVKVDFAPVPGAKDYRIYDVSNPNDVKYAGIWHLDADTLNWPWSNQMFAVDSNGNPIYPLHVVTTPNGQWSNYHHIDVPATEI